MATVDLSAGTVMNAVSALMNDHARTVYTYTVQIPYLRIAMKELQEEFELNNVPVTQETSATIEIPTGYDAIRFNVAAPYPELPDGLIEPMNLHERESDVGAFTLMTRRDFLPKVDPNSTTSCFGVWSWISNEVRFNPSNRDNDIKIDYIRQLFTDVVDENSQINVINAETFLEYRTAALMAEFIERNEGNTEALNSYAVLAIDRALGIQIKNEQSILTRRRPFRAGFKRRGMI